MIELSCNNYIFMVFIFIQGQEHLILVDEKQKRKGEKIFQVENYKPRVIKEKKKKNVCNICFLLRIMVCDS